MTLLEPSRFSHKAILLGILIAVGVNAVLLAGLWQWNRSVSTPPVAPRSHLRVVQALAEPPPRQVPPPPQSSPAPISFSTPSTPAPTTAPLTPTALPLSPLTVSVLAAPAIPVSVPATTATRQDSLPSEDLHDILPDQPMQEDVVDQPPREIQCPDPRYPRLALQRGLEGAVKLRMLVSANGCVERHEVISVEGHSSFRRAVEETLPTWKLEPACHRGRPVAVWVNKTIHFELRQGGRR